MQRPILLCVFAAMLFGAGLLAGQGLDSRPASAPLIAESTSDDPAPPLNSWRNWASAVAPGVPTTAVPVTAVSHESRFTDELSRAPGSETERVSETETQLFAMADRNSRTTDSPPQKRDSIRQQIVDLINRIFPNTSPEVASTWADAYETMEPAEVEFILDQKRLLSESLDSLISDDTISVLPSPLLPSPLSPLESPASAALPESAAALNSALMSVRRNLDSVWCTGFHRTVILPEVMSLADGSAGAHITTFTSFEPGRIIASPMPLHVALHSKNGAFLFRLEGDKFTRRGDFQLLPDRRIGLHYNDTGYALNHCTALPEGADDIRFSADGKIEYEDTSGQSMTAGQLEVVELPQLDQLTTVDGIVFANTSTKPAAAVPAEVAGLAIRSLELSNVNREEESSLLLHLEKVANDLKRSVPQGGRQVVDLMGVHNPKRK